MNPEDYAEKAVEITPLPFNREVGMDQAGCVALRSGYPTPQYGVMIYCGKRGDADGGIDWAVKHLRRTLADLIRNVADDCISVINQDIALDEQSRRRLKKAIQDHFETYMQ